MKSSMPSTTVPRALAAAVAAALALGAAANLRAADNGLSPSAEQQQHTIAGAGTAAEDVPVTKHQADVLGGTAQEQTGPEVKEESKEGMPATQHQGTVLRNFSQADKNRDGRLDENEFKQFQATSQSGTRGGGAAAQPQGAAGESGMSSGTGGTQPGKAATADIPPTPHQAKVLAGKVQPETAAQMEEQKKTLYPETVGGMPVTVHQMTALNFKDADLDQSGAVNFMEVYATEQGVPAGQPRLPFRADALEHAIAQGGFKSVDANNDGVVSVDEAAESSMLSMKDESIYDFQSADSDVDGTLDEQEFAIFQAKISENVTNAKSTGEFPGKYTNQK